MVSSSLHKIGSIWLACTQKVHSFALGYQSYLTPTANLLYAFIWYHLILSESFPIIHSVILRLPSVQLFFNLTKTCWADTHASPTPGAGNSQAVACGGATITKGESKTFEKGKSISLCSTVWCACCSRLWATGVVLLTYPLSVTDPIQMAVILT